MPYLNHALFLSCHCAHLVFNTDVGVNKNFSLSETFSNSESHTISSSKCSTISFISDISKSKIFISILLILANSSSNFS